MPFLHLATALAEPIVDPPGPASTEQEHAIENAVKGALGAELKARPPSSERFPFEADFGPQRGVDAAARYSDHSVTDRPVEKAVQAAVQAGIRAETKVAGGGSDWQLVATKSVNGSGGMMFSRVGSDLSAVTGRFSNRLFSVTQHSESIF